MRKEVLACNLCGEIESPENTMNGIYISDEGEEKLFSYAENSMAEIHICQKCLIGLKDLF